MKIHSKAVLLILVLLVASCAHTDDRKQMEAATIHYRLGEVYFKEGNFHAALKEFVQSVEMDPLYAKSQHYLGLTYFARRLYDNARVHLREAVRLDPDFPEARMNLGALYLETRDWDMAIPEFEAIIKNIFYSTPELAYNNLGWAYFGKGEYTRALEYFEKAVELSPGFSMAYNNMGKVLVKLDRNRDAMQAYRTAIRLSPRFADAYYNLGLALVKAKDHEGAVESFNKVIEVAPDSDKARMAKDYLELLK